MCCADGWDHGDAKINGVCPDCGRPTVDGDAVYGCHYSPILCHTCGFSPCDGSC
jgi:hypothetical protein